MSWDKRACVFDPCSSLEVGEGHIAPEAAEAKEESYEP